MPSKHTDLTRNDVKARMAKPERATKGAVLVLPSAAGFNAFNDRVLDDLAQAGFLALAWDPFSKNGDMTQEQRMKYSADQMKDADAVREQLDLVAFLYEQPGIQSVGTLGFCMGGRMAMLVAADDARVKAAVGFYPTMRDPRPPVAIDLPPVAAKASCPVMVHAPGKDVLTSHASFERLRSALYGREAATLFQWYPKAHHGFYGKSAEDNRDDYEAGLLAWPATVAFFKAALL